MFQKIKDSILKKNRDKVRSYVADDINIINSSIINLNDEINDIKTINASNTVDTSNKLNMIYSKITFNTLYNIICRDVNVKSAKGDSVTFLNSTYGDYHHGCSATSYVIHEKLKNHFKHVDVIPIKEVKTIKEELKDINLFDDLSFFKQIEKKYKEIFDILNNNDNVVINGEGCISHYNNDTLALLYLIYISKTRYGKNVYLINTSILNSDFIRNISNQERIDLDIVLKKVLSVIDFVGVREQLSYSYVKSFGINNVYQTFDSLPIYVRNYFNPVNIKQNNYILITGGNDMVNHNLNDVVKLIDMLNSDKSLKLYFLISHVENGICQDDEEMFNKLSKINKSIKKVVANSTDEWLTYIKNAKYLVSGRFHHSIAAFMLNTNFIAFNTNTYKMVGMLSLIGKMNNFISADEEIQKDKIEGIINNNSIIEDSMIQREIVTIAERNYSFISTINEVNKDE